MIVKKIPLLLSCAFLVLSTPGALASFTDTTEDSILYFQRHDILQGFPDGSFRPNANINRAEFIKILVEARHMQNTTYTPKCFSDIPQDAWFEKYVCIGKELQLVSGYEDGTFRPGNEVTKAEAVKMILGKVDYDISAIKVPYKDMEKDSWYYPFILSAYDNGLIDKAKKFFPHTPSTRKEVTELLFRYTLSSTIPVYSGTCARPSTLASCARDFFTIEHAAEQATIEKDTPQITTSSGTTFGVVKLTPPLELEETYPNYPMIHEFRPEELLCLIKITNTGEKSYIWWKRTASHHMKYYPTLTMDSKGKVLLHEDYNDGYSDPNSRSGGYIYAVDEETLRLEQVFP